MRRISVLLVLAVSGGSAFAHAVEDTIGSDSGSSVINVVTYYQEHAARYPRIHPADPGASDWSALIQDVANEDPATKPGRIIFFPGGTYRIESTVVINSPSNTPLTFLGVGGAYEGGTVKGSVIQCTGGTTCIKLVAPKYNVRFTDLQLEGGGRANGGTAVLADFAAGYVARCSFENLTINGFHYGFRLDGYADGMVFNHIRLSNVNRGFFLKHTEGSSVRDIEAVPFYDYVFYLYQCSGLTIRNVRATSENLSGSKAKAFIVSGAGSTGKSIEIDGVCADTVNSVAVITCPSVRFTNVRYTVSAGTTISEDAFVFGKVSDLNPVNVTIENAVFDLAGALRPGKKDISLRRDGESIDLVESVGTSAEGTTCRGLRVINSDLDLSDIPTTRYSGSYIAVTKTLNGVSWVGNQRKISYGAARPTAAGNRGDIVWNVQPAPAEYLGWTYTGSTTGWKGFGKIECAIPFVDNFTTEIGNWEYAEGPGSVSWANQALRITNATATNGLTQARVANPIDIYQSISQGVDVRIDVDLPVHADARYGQYDHLMVKFDDENYVRLRYRPEQYSGAGGIYVEGLAGGSPIAMQWPNVAKAAWHNVAMHFTLAIGPTHVGWQGQAIGDPASAQGASFTHGWDLAALRSGTLYLGFERTGLYSGYDHYVEWDNVAMAGAGPLVAIEGKMILQGYVGDNASVHVNFQLRPLNGLAEITRGAVLNADGSYHLDNISQGVYAMTVRVPFCLTRVLDNVTVGDDPTVLPPVELKAADNNGDDRITFEDFALLQNNYSRSGAAGTERGTPAAAAAGRDGCGPLGMMLIVLLGLAFAKGGLG